MYIAGASYDSEGNYTACYWIDGVRVELPGGAWATDIVVENGNVYVGNATEVCNELNAIFSSSGTPSADSPTITSPLSINLTQGEIINYELTANLGVGYEWDLSNVPGVTTVDGNVRKLIGGSSLTTGEYAIPVKAINYNGEDSQIIELSVGNPAFANTKSVNFNNNDWLGANAGILQNTLGRTGNGSGISSDQRLKKNIADLADGQLAKINALTPRAFEWKDSRKAGHKEGFIAQEVATIIPEAISEVTFAPDPADTSRDFEGPIKIINPDVMNARLIKAVQELSAELTAAKARITTLEG